MLARSITKTVKYLIRPLALFLCALFSVSAFGQASPKDKWIRLKTPNFNLIGNAGEKDMRLVATRLEQFRTAFGSIFPQAKMTSSIPSNVVVFKSSSSYNPYRPKRGDGKPDEGIAGYFQAGEDVNYITLSAGGERADTFGTIFHEYVHSLMNNTFGKSSVPPWFNEGLAEYYQTFEIQDDQKVALGNLQEVHLQLLQQVKLIPLKQFFAVDNYSLHQNGGHSRSIFYAQAWALMHYLIQGNGGANLGSLNKFLQQVLNNVDPEKAFQSAFGMDYATMERALRKYVEQRTFVRTIVTFQNKLVFDDKFAVSPLSEAQANAYLGDLLYHTHEYPDAEAHLVRSLELEPGLSMAHTSLGLVKMRQRNFADARKFLEKAIADDAGNHFAHYNYAYALSREGMDEFGFVTKYEPDTLRKMLASLKRSIQLEPDFPESYRLLAFVTLTSGENLDEAVSAIRKGMSLQPGNQNYAMMLAQVYMRQKKFDEARAVVDRLSKTADDEQIRRAAAQMRDSLDQYFAAVKSSEKEMEELRSGKLTGGRPPVILKRGSMTAEEFAKIEQDRVMRNLNSIIAKPEEGEQQALGSIEKVECRDGQVFYSARTKDGPLLLTSKDFQSLRMEILHEGTTNVSVGCDSDLKGQLIAITYRPAAAPGANSRSVLTGLSFVPNDFRFMTAEEMKERPYIIVEGGPPTDTARNSEQSAQEIADMERKRREMILEQIEKAMRRPLDGEVRVMGTLQKVECSGSTAFYNILSGIATLRLRVPEDHKKVTIMAFTQEAAGAQFQCGSSLPNVSAVVTYRPGTESRSKVAGELVAVEFVPKSFVLPAN